MKYTEAGFRAVYHNFCVFPLTDVTRNAVRSFPGREAAEGVLVYGYYDREAGVTLEVLGCAKKGPEGGWYFADPAEEIRSFIRIEAVQDDDFSVLQGPAEPLNRRYARKLELLKAYDASEAVEVSRRMDFLDESRHPQFIDDVLVYLEKKGLEPEGCWARMTDVTERELRAKLLNEPDQDFGIHKGEDFTFFVHQDEETGRITCHAQFSPMETIDPETLADGKQLKEYIHRFHEDNADTDALFWIFQILRDSDVWVPCNAIVGEEDRKAVEQMIEEAGDDLSSMAGKEFTAQGDIRLVPDILQRDEQYFFPAFITEEDMGEYGEGFSKVQEPFLRVIEQARSSKTYEGGLAGIVINAFTEPFILPKELYEAVEKMVSRIES